MLFELSKFRGLRIVSLSRGKGDLRVLHFQLLLRHETATSRSLQVGARGPGGPASRGQSVSPQTAASRLWGCAALEWEGQVDGGGHVTGSGPQHPPWGVGTVRTCVLGLLQGARVHSAWRACRIPGKAPGACLYPRPWAPQGVLVPRPRSPEPDLGSQGCRLSRRTGVCQPAQTRGPRGNTGGSRRR